MKLDVEELICDVCKFLFYFIINIDVVNVEYFFKLLWLQVVDGIDNGINLYDIDKFFCYLNDIYLLVRVGRLNFDWMDEQILEVEDEVFCKVMSFVGSEFLEVFVQIFLEVVFYLFFKVDLFGSFCLFFLQ